MPVPDLRAELLVRRERDSEARWAVIRDGAPWRSVADLDEENTAWLKLVVDEVGFPTRSMVGDDGVAAAWLLAQHADLDPAFQRRCLDLLAPLVASGEVDARHFAYLTDRVLLKEEGRQIYGTQCTTRGGEYAPDRLDEPDGVDERRRSVGLGPMADYLATMYDRYGAPKPPSFVCPGCAATIPVPADGSGTRFACPSCRATFTLGAAPESS